MTISQKTVSLSGSKTYDGGVNLTGSDVSISTGVGSETLSYSGATVSSKDVAVSNKYIDAITLGDATDGSGGLASNYHLPSLDAVHAPVVVEPANLVIQAFDEVKTYGRGAVLDENVFGVRGMQGVEQVTTVSLLSDGGSTSAALGYYDIVPSEARGPNFDPNNYDIVYLYGALLVEASPFEQKTALVSIESVQNRIFLNETSSIQSVDTSTFSTITPTSIGPPPPTFINATPTTLVVPPSVLSTIPVTPPPTSVAAPSTSTIPLELETGSTPITIPEASPVLASEPTPVLVTTPEVTPTPELTYLPATTPEATLTPESTPAPATTPEPTPTPESTPVPAAEASTMQNSAKVPESSTGLTVDLVDSPDTTTVGLITVTVTGKFSGSVRLGKH